MQVPRRPAEFPSGSSGSGEILAALSPCPVQALSERVRTFRRNRHYRFLTSSPSKLWVQADTSVAPDCESGVDRPNSEL